MIDWCKSRWHTILNVTVICVLAAVGSYIAGAEAGKKGAEAAEKTTTAAAAKGCSRNQVQRTYDRVDETADRKQTDAINALRDSRQEGEARPPKLSYTPLIANRYFQIVNCGATYRPGYTGDPVYLEGKDEDCFIHLVISGYFLRREPITDPRVLREVCVTSYR